MANGKKKVSSISVNISNADFSSTFKAYTLFQTHQLRRLLEIMLESYFVDKDSDRQEPVEYTLQLESCREHELMLEIRSWACLGCMLGCPSVLPVADCPKSMQPTPQMG